MRFHLPTIIGPRLLTALLVSSVLVFSQGCGGDSDYTAINFSNTIQAKLPTSEEDHRRALRVAVAAMISPKETFSYYRELLDYIGDALGHRIQLIQRKTYGELNEMFFEGLIDIAFICTGPYAVGKEKYGFEALATPIVRGKPFYQSYLIVNKDSPFQRLEDLKGHIFAFTDPDSNTGFLIPSYWLTQTGVRTDRFFEKVIYTYSHDNSIFAVARALVDGAAIDGHIWEYYRIQDPVYTSKTRIVKKSDMFGSPPLVSSIHLSPQLKNRIREMLFSMHQTHDGDRILKNLMIDRFVPPQEDWYEPVKKIIQTMQATERISYATEEPSR